MCIHAHACPCTGSTEQECGWVCTCVYFLFLRCLDLVCSIWAFLCVLVSNVPGLPHWNGFLLFFLYTWRNFHLNIFYHLSSVLPSCWLMLCLKMLTSFIKSPASWRDFCVQAIIVFPMPRWTLSASHLSPPVPRPPFPPLAIHPLLPIIPRPPFPRIPLLPSTLPPSSPIDYHHFHLPPASFLQFLQVPGISLLHRCWQNFELTNAASSIIIIIIILHTACTHIINYSLPSGRFFIIVTGSAFLRPNNSLLLIARPNCKFIHLGF